jgi:hypothetical protein
MSRYKWRSGEAAIHLSFAIVLADAHCQYCRVYILLYIHLSCFTLSHSAAKINTFDVILEKNIRMY